MPTNKIVEKSWLNSNFGHEVNKPKTTVRFIFLALSPRIMEFRVHGPQKLIKIRLEFLYHFGISFQILSVLAGLFFFTSIL